ncbi:hypothetical protein FQR65_LT17389 [Abscondita terminalis]|nr:hypothetical protein FQR65_LT17389 [Abscondita terminalis]
MAQKVAKNNTNCCVYGCHSKKSADSTISFHKFPRKNKNKIFLETEFGSQKLDRFKAWELKLLMGKKITGAMKVCSLHFKKSDYVLSEYSCIKPRLIKNAVPSMNLPQKSPYENFHEAQKKERCLRLLERRQKQMWGEVLAATNQIHTDELVTSLENKCNDKDSLHKEIAARALLDLGQTPVVELCKVFTDKAIQVTSGDIVVSFVSTINTDSKLNTLTGIPSFGLLNAILELRMKYGNEKRKRKLCLKYRIILTFIKLKTGLKYSVIKILFNVVSITTCVNIFRETICLLYKVLRPVIVWPDLKECQSNLPHCFAEFEKVRVVLDCTEIQVAIPKCLCCRLKCYSHYKGKHTIKFMTGVSPAGLITFISSVHGGRASDKVIFEQSELIKKLNMGVDQIMVDKGFLIQDITNSYGTKVVQPPFLKNKQNFSKEEALLNVKIAKAGVHIEQCNQRIKTLDIFNKTLQWPLAPLINEIFTVICAIVNLTSPILSDDKFVCDQ